MRIRSTIITTLIVLSMTGLQPAWAQQASCKPGGRVLLDAHNCYPYHRLWSNRMERALKIGPPIAVELDLAWYTDPKTGKSWSIISHGEPFSGNEPTVKTYFFEQVRPIVEGALQKGDKKDWPLFTLNLEIGANQPEHHQAIWQLLGEYDDWLCTAERVADPRRVMPIDIRPVLVLAWCHDAPEETFHDAVPIGDRLRLFGTVRVHKSGWDVPPGQMVRGRATNYRRWWPTPWTAIEPGGQTDAGEWTPEEQKRLQSLVDHAHARGLWIRFYSLNGHPPADSFRQGWGRHYNFGSPERVQKRWRAAIEAGVDFVATDQYEDFAAFLAECRNQ